MKRGLIITIDGPSGSGKSTAARLLARRLKLLYLDTGAMYRAVALKALKSGTSLQDVSALARLARNAQIRFSRGASGGRKILLDGRDVSRAIRHPKVGEAASRIAILAPVRRELVKKQQVIGEKGGIVAEGRDTGTVVFPKAPVKFSLTADPAERARRRWQELTSTGYRIGFPKVVREQSLRDRRDKSRNASPLRVAQGAILINNTGLQSSETLDKMVDYVRRIQK